MLLLLLPLAAASLAAQEANGELKITEVIYDSTHTPVSLDHNYWWELTNLGPESVNLQGYSWDDNEPTAGAFPFPNIIIEPTESIIILERLDESTAVQDFRNCWGAEVDDVTIHTATDFGMAALPGFGLGGILFLFERANERGRVDPVPDPVQGFSNECLPGGPCRVSVDGENGAYQASCGDVGSPGRISASIPAVSTWGMAALVLLVMAAGTIVFRRVKVAA